MIEQLINLYSQFLSLFPSYLHFWISLVIFLGLVFGLLDLIKKSWLWLLLLVIFLPASIPLLKQIATGLIRLLEFFLSR